MLSCKVPYYNTKTKLDLTKLFLPRSFTTSTANVIILNS